MNRRQLTFVVLVNALVSLVVALGVILLFEMRRPDPEELAAINTPRVEPVLAASGEPQIATPGGALADGQIDTGQSSGEPTGDSGASADSATDAPAAANDQNDAETAAENQDDEYVVQAGDSLSIIAGRYNITIDDIVRANNLANPDSIFSGQRLVIPLQGQRAAEQNAEPSAPLGEGVEIAIVENPGEHAGENVLIVNESNLAFSLLGWQLLREGGPTYTFGNVPLFPGSSVRVHTRAGEDSSIDLFWGESSAHWQSNSVARLVNTQGVEIFRYTVP
ncbi:MAG: LysM peptidoglycan-binding domain-containing protein [Litorilinea sp.]